MIPMKKIILLCLILILNSCSSSVQEPADDPINSSADLTQEENLSLDDEALIAQITSYFDVDVLTKDITIEDCILSAGATSRCYAVTVDSWLSDADIWPFCPSNISDDASEGWIWLKDGTLHEVDGPFIENLAELYEDDAWNMYSEATGEINVTEGLEECQAAANPQVPEEYQNHCVECMLSYLEDFSETTYYIPVVPVNLESPSGTSRDAMWIAFNWVKYEVSAPVDVILAAYTIAPFDDCGWHVNPNVWYHYHAYQSDEEGCSPQYEVADHTALIGFAMDGYMIYGQDDNIETDSCGWHDTEELGYHYHIDWDSNEHLGCSTAEYACVDTEWTGECDATLTATRWAWWPPGGWDRPAWPPLRGVE